MGRTLYVGVDWGHEESQVHAEWGEGEVVLKKRVPSTVQSLTELVSHLRSLAGDGELRVLIESKGGLIVQTLIDLEVPVYATNPKLVDRARTLWGMAEAKDDKRDAEVLAWMLRSTERSVQKVFAPDEWLSRARALSRRHADITAKSTAVQNQLTDRLRAGYPGAVGLELDRQWVLDALVALPSPRAAAAPGARETLGGIMKKARVRAKVDVVLENLQTLAPSVPEGLDLYEFDIKCLAEQLKVLWKQGELVLAKLDELQDPLIDAEEPSDVQVVRSMFGIGSYVGATLFGEGLIAMLKADLETARAYAGVAPVSTVTGKRQTQGRPLVSMRRACNKRVRNALTYAVENRMRRDPSFRARYVNLRARGHEHYHACRQLADRMLKELRAMLRDGTKFVVATEDSAAAA